MVPKQLLLPICREYVLTNKFFSYDYGKLSKTIEGTIDNYCRLLMAPTTDSLPPLMLIQEIKMPDFLHFALKDLMLHLANS